MSMTRLERLYSSAESKGISICDVPPAGISCVSIKINNSYYIGINRKKLKSTSDETVKIAHELGHCVTDSFYTQSDDKRKRYRCEKKADEWAITKIVPEESFVRALKEGCREPWEFAEEFGVTEDFARKVMNYYAKKLNHIV